MGAKKEGEYYKPIKERLEELLRTKYYEFHLEITAYKRFSNQLKGKVGLLRDIVFYFLREAAPDIAGYIGTTYFVHNVLVVEVKTGKIKLDDIYQTKKYAELLDARYALLISTKEIPEEIKRLSNTVTTLLSLPVGRLTLVHYDEEALEFTEWFRENPF